MSPDRDDLTARLQDALALHQRGQLAQARAIYEEVLRRRPDHADCLHLLGVLAGQTGNHGNAVDLIGRALAIHPNNPAFHNNRGNALRELGRLDEAVASFDRAIALKADYADAHVNRANALRTLRRFEAALAGYDRVVALKPDLVQAWFDRGTVLQALGQLDAAVASYDRAIALKPDLADAFYNRGLALRERGDADTALASYERAIALDPGLSEAYYNRGNVLRDLQRLDAAIESYDGAIALKPDYAEAHYNRGVALREIGQIAAALVSFDRALAINPGYAMAYMSRGVARQDLKQLDAALDDLDRAIALNPGYAEARFNRGNILRDMQRPDAALDSYDRAIAIRPDYAEVYSNRGNVLHLLRRRQEALDSYDRAIALKPDYADAYCNRGTVLQEMKQFDAAYRNYDRAIALVPDHAEAYWNKSLGLLLNGDLAAGFDLYEWRFRRKRALDEKNLLAPEWDGTRVNGALLVLSEQGVGDELFYSGMLNDLRARADSVTAVVDPRLAPLFQRSFPGIDIVPRTGFPLHRKFAAQVYMGTLGRYLRADGPGLKSVRVPYLKADPERVKTLRGKIARPGKIVCGLSWVSKNPDCGVYKSSQLMPLAPLLALKNFAFVDLQYGDTDAEQQALRATTGLALIRVPEVDNFNDLDGLAALIEACDLIVTVSTVTAHFAGGLGKTLTVMLSESSGLLWYWHDHRQDSPWYPTAKLYRQDRLGDWPGVVERVRQDLVSEYPPV